MTLVVTAATGQLGRLVVENLLDRGVPAADIVATGRRLDRLKDLADRGVQTRVADYADPATLRTAFAGACRVLLVSGSEPGARLDQHRNAIEAAREAGVELIAYTSIVNADTSTLLMAQDHQATEALLRESGVPFTLLRNSWYLENYTDHLVPVLQYGTLLGSAGEGRVSAATRADYAAAAATVLITDGHAGRAYELGADEPFTLTELAAAITEHSGTQVHFADLSETEHAQALTANGAPEAFADILADADQGLRRGELHTASGDLTRLIGRPTTSLAQAITTTVHAVRQA